MDWAVINWEAQVYTLKQIEEINDEVTGFYAILGAKGTDKGWRDLDLLYIGMAFSQTVEDRVQQNHEAYNYIKLYLKEDPGKEIIIIVGELVKCSLGRITEKFIKEVECCLISSNQPWCNVTCVKSYTGRPLLITNEGDFAPLKKRSPCK